VYFTAPIIEDSSKYVTGKAYVKWNLIRKFDNSNHCRFVYTYLSREYKRYQKLVDKSIAEGDIVEIFINKEMPRIAYVKGNSSVTK